MREYNYVGYPCMNHTLRKRNPPLRCNRDMQKKTFEDRGLSYAGELALQNLEDLYKIIQWNVNHGIYFYRCTSKLVPWNSRYSLKSLPNFTEIKKQAKIIGTFIESNSIRLTFHPSHWVKLASPTKSTVNNSVTSLNNHGQWLDLLGLRRSPYYSINIHIGAHYNNKDATAERFRENFEKLSSSAQSRLIVENDDKQSLWGVEELAKEVSAELSIPITFDYHHHQFTDTGLTHQEAFELAKTTWPDGITPITHYSEPKRLHERDATIRPQAHADTITPPQIPLWLLEESHIMLETGNKEQSVKLLHQYFS